MQLQNSAAVRPFECLLSLLPLPRYGTIDATSYVATFFPPMFGLMLADVGYGLLLVIAATLLYWRARGRAIQRSLSIVLAWCAGYTIVFGFVFGELFGSLGHTVGLQPLWRSRMPEEASQRGGG